MKKCHKKHLESPFPVNITLKMNEMPIILIKHHSRQTHKLIG